MKPKDYCTMSGRRRIGYMTLFLLFYGFPLIYGKSSNVCKCNNISGADSFHITLHKKCILPFFLAYIFSSKES